MSRRFLAPVTVVLAVGTLASCGPRKPTAPAAPSVSTTVIAAPPSEAPAPTTPASTAAPTPAPAPPPTSAESRPFPVDTVTLPLVDRARATVSHGHTVLPSRALTTLVWFPAAPGRWPLVVFAHGYKVGPEPYAQLCQSWAAAGYVVAAPEFPLTDSAVAGSALDESDLANQPADVHFVIASLLASSSPVLSHIQPDRVAVAGHSDGAETALASAADTTLDLRAAIVLSGAPLGDGPAVNPPILVVQGDQDAINDPSEGQAVYDAASPPRFLLRLLGAGHLPPFTGPSPWQGVIRDTTVDFLDRYLAGRPEAANRLAGDARNGPATLVSTP